MTWAYVCGIIVCIIFSHIFSSAEMSYSSCNRMRLENARDDGSKRAKVAVKIVDNFDDSLSAILIGNNLANIATPRSARCWCWSCATAMTAMRGCQRSR